MEFVKLTSVFFTTILLVFPAESAFETIRDNPLAISLSGAGCASPQTDAFHPNPAFAPQHWTFGLSYHNLYQIPELKQSHLSMRIPLYSLSLGSEFFAFGDKAYRERVLSLSCAKLWKEKLATGVKISFFHLAIDGCGTVGAFSYSGGGIYHPFDNLSVGFILNNINRPFLGKSGEKLCADMQFGLSYRPTETSEILCDAYLTPHFKREIKMGLQFTPSSNLKLRAGTSDLTRMISAGCDIEWKNLSFLYSLNYHQLLGWTNSVGIEFKKLK